MTGKEIIEAIKNANISVGDFAYGDFDSPEEVGEWEEVEQYGGEGKGTDWYSIKYFKEHDVYIRTEGYYQSYSGTEFYDGYGEEVKPKEVTVTQYFTV